MPKIKRSMTHSTTSKVCPFINGATMNIKSISKLKDPTLLCETFACFHHRKM